MHGVIKYKPLDEAELKEMALSLGYLYNRVESHTLGRLLATIEELRGGGKVEEPNYHRILSAWFDKHETIESVDVNIGDKQHRHIVRICRIFHEGIAPSSMMVMDTGVAGKESEYICRIVPSNMFDERFVHEGVSDETLAAIRQAIIRLVSE